MMVAEFVSDLHSVGQVQPDDMWRCVSCGEMVDPLVLMNRKKATESVPVR